MKTVIIAFVLALSCALGTYLVSSSNEFERAFFVGFGVFYGAILTKIMKDN